jgi:hypothetical protein
MCSMSGAAGSTSEFGCFDDVGQPVWEPDEWRDIQLEGFEYAWDGEWSELWLVETNCVWLRRWIVADVDIREGPGDCVHGEHLEIRHIVVVSSVWGGSREWTILDDGGKPCFECELDVLCWGCDFERLEAREWCEQRVAELDCSGERSGGYELFSISDDGRISM